MSAANVISFILIKTLVTNLLAEPLKLCKMCSQVGKCCIVNQCLKPVVTLRIDNQHWIPALSCPPPTKFIIVLNVLWSIYASKAEAGMILENEYIHIPWPCMKGE